MADDSQSCDTAPLHIAASRGDSDEVGELLKSKQYEVDYRNSNNQTSLHLACANGHLDTVWILAKYFGADIGAIDNSGNTPLLFAAKNKHVQIIIMLVILSLCGRHLSNRVYVSCSYQMDSHHIKIFEDVLFEYHNDSEEVENTMLMINEFFVQFKDYNDDGFLTLCVAASLGLKDLIDRLVTDNANLNIRGFYGLSILHCACFGGHVLLVQSLISEYGMDLSVKDNDGCSVLHYATLKGIPYRCDGAHIELIDKLVMEYGLDPAVRDDYGNTPLHHAAFKGRVETVRHLISKHSADIDCTNNQNTTPLMLAALYGHEHLLDALFNSSCNVRGYNGFTLLHYACFGGHIKLINKLVMDYGLDLTDKDNDGDTPLHIAAMAGHVETVRHLISKHRADIVCTNNKNNGSLMLAALHGNTHVLGALVKEFNSSRHVRGYTLLHSVCEHGPLHIAAMKGHVETVRHLIIKHSADIDCTNNQNNTPLMLAALNGHVDVLDALVKEFNSSCNVRGYNGYTLLHQACNGGHIELIDKLVIEYGLDLADKDDDGNTPLHIAAGVGHVETVKHLINNKHSADIDITNNSNMTPWMLAALNDHVIVFDVLVKEFSSRCHVHRYTLLHLACKHGHIELIDKLVMKYGLDRDNYGNTPLHIAAKAGHVETVRHLIIKHKVDFNITNSDNSTPLCSAVECGHEIVIHVLIKEFNCSPHVRGFNGQTLLHYACQNGYIELLNKLVGNIRWIQKLETTMGTHLCIFYVVLRILKKIS